MNIQRLPFRGGIDLEEIDKFVDFQAIIVAIKKNNTIKELKNDRCDKIVIESLSHKRLFGKKSIGFMDLGCMWEVGQAKETMERGKVVFHVFLEQRGWISGKDNHSKKD